MTVKELIRELEKHNPETRVITYDSDWGPVVIDAVSEEEGDIVLHWDMIHWDN